jgi:cytochrome b561
MAEKSMNAMPEMPGGQAEFYDRRTVWLHWCSAALVLLIWGSAQLIDFFAKGPPRWNMLGLHMAMGLLLLLLLLLRIGWRWHGGRRLAPPEGRLWRWLSNATHYGLYGLLLVQIALGLANAWVRGEHVFTWFVIPAYDPADKALRTLVGNLHELAADVILVVAGLHASAALYHHYVLHDGILRRMGFQR